MDIAKLKKHISWYLNQSQSVMGERSNYYTILNTQFGAIPYDTNMAVIGSLKGIRRHRLIHNALLCLPHTEFRYIQALYNEEYQGKYPPIIRNIFMEKTGLALCLSYDLKHLQKLCSQSYHKIASIQEEHELNTLIVLTNITYDKLHSFLKHNAHIIQLEKLGAYAHDQPAV